MVEASILISIGFYRPVREGHSVFNCYNLDELHWLNAPNGMWRKNVAALICCNMQLQSVK